MAGNRLVFEAYAIAGLSFLERSTLPFGPFVSSDKILKLGRFDPPFPTDFDPLQQAITNQSIDGVRCGVEPSRDLFDVQQWLCQGG